MSNSFEHAEDSPTMWLAGSVFMLELQLTAHPTAAIVHELAELYGELIEQFEAQKNPLHLQLQDRLRALLTRPDTRKILMLHSASCTVNPLSQSMSSIKPVQANPQAAVQLGQSYSQTVARAKIDLRSQNQALSRKLQVRRKLHSRKPSDEGQERTLLNSFDFDLSGLGVKHHFALNRNRHVSAYDQRSVGMFGRGFKETPVKQPGAQRHSNLQRELLSDLHSMQEVVQPETKVVIED